MNQETGLSQTPGAICTGYLSNLVMKAIKPPLFFWGTWIYSAIFVRIPKISVYQILQHPLGSIQLEEGDFKMVPEADF